VVEWIAVGVSLVAAAFAGWSIRYARRAARAAERDAAAAENSARLAAETARIDKQRFHDDRRPRDLELFPAETADGGEDPHEMVLLNRTNTAYVFQPVLIFSDGVRVDGQRSHLRARGSARVNVANTGHGRRAETLELWIDDGCLCGEPEGELGHWKMTLDVPPYIDVRFTVA
jgi:hypothetical protein